MTKLKDSLELDKRRFVHLSNQYNEHYIPVLCYMPSFLVNIYPKSEKLVCVESEPKWFSIFYDREKEKNVAFDSWKRSYLKKRKLAMSFADVYEPMYQERKISMLFYTFTRAEYSTLEFKDMVHLLKKTFENNGYPILGYFWVAECSNNFHWHYHLAISIDRINLKGKHLPKWFYFTKQWGQRVNCTFVTKSIRNYLSKYFSKKNKYRLTGIKNVGKSNRFLTLNPNLE